MAMATKSEVMQHVRGMRAALREMERNLKDSPDPEALEALASDSTYQRELAGMLENVVDDYVWDREQERTALEEV